MSEQTPLLPGQQTRVAGRALMTGQLLTQAVPLVLRYLLYVSYNMLQLYFAPRYARNGAPSQIVLIAALSLSNLFANVSCLSVLFGMASAVETLGSQYRGARQNRQVGLTLQRAVLILASVAVSLVPLWYYAESLFLLAGIDAQVCAVVGQLLRIRILSLPADILRESYEGYSLALGLMLPPLLGSVATNLLLLALNLLFVRVGLSYLFLAWAFMLAQYFGVIVLLASSWRDPAVRETMQAPDAEALLHWDRFIAIGLPSVLQVCAEWWAYEVLTLFAAALGSVGIAAQAIIFQFIVLCFMIPMGFQVSLVNLVGTALGEGDGKQARALSWNALLVASVVQLLVSLAVLLWGAEFIAVFSADPQVCALTVRAVPFIAVYTLLDGFQGVAAGILKGAGKQTIGAYLNFVAFYLIGLPAAWCCCNRLGLGVNGLVFGMSFGTLFQVLSITYLLLFHDHMVFSAVIHVPSRA